MNKKEKQDFPMVKQFTIQSLHYNICSPFPHLQKKNEKVRSIPSNIGLHVIHQLAVKNLICSLKNFAQGTNQA